MGEQLNATLDELAQQQVRMFTTEELIRQQMKRGRTLISEMTKVGQDLVCELRLLSLVRCKIMKGTYKNAESVLKSQTFQGLKFATLQYCPDFVEPNQLNQCQTFVAHLRRSPDVMSRVLFEYARKRPDRAHRLAFSCFLAIFQQGWCVEEDDLLVKVLLEIAKLQRENGGEGLEEGAVQGPRKLKFPLSAPQCSLSGIEPFATFATAYLFNVSSFAYLQSALAPIILELHSLSQLCEIRNKFILATGSCVLPCEYWKEICDFALKVFRRLMTCFELLPPGLFLLFAGLKELGFDLKLVFFEAFINQALDNPAILGLLPWHPSYEGWRPGSDIADVFRSKFGSVLRSKRYLSLAKALSDFESYKQIDLDVFVEKLATPKKVSSSFMIREAELLATNPNFPKEVLVTGNTLRLLCDAVIETKIDEAGLMNVARRMNFEVDEGSDNKQHFKVVMLRKGSPTSEISNHSLFVRSPSKDIEQKVDDCLTETLCNVFSLLPPFPSLISSIQPKSLAHFFDSICSLLPLVLPEEDVVIAEVSLWMAEQRAENEKELLDNIKSLVELREGRSLAVTDDVVCLQTQHSAMQEALNVVQEIRKNVQSHVLLAVANMIMDNDMKDMFAESMKRSHQYTSNLDVFAKDVKAVVSASRTILKQFVQNSDYGSSITRIIFFRLAETITFGQFAKINPVNWKRSIIVSKILELHAQQMLDSFHEKNPSILSKQKYLKQASDMLGHIRNSSVFAAVIHTLFETISIVQTLVDNCSDINTDACMVVTILTSRAKHPFLITKFVQHFLLGPLTGGFLETIFSSAEIGIMAVIPSSILMILDMCSAYDRRISPDWLHSDVETP